MSRSIRTPLLVAGLVALAAGGLAALRAPEGARTLHGQAVAVGGGTARMYVEVDAAGKPAAVGFELTASALEGLATEMNTTSRCWDKDGSGHHSHGECLGDFQSTLSMPRGSEALGLPVRWGTINWNPEGHIPPAPEVWSAPHFDFHFFMADQAVIDGIRPGPCGEYIDCQDFEVATKALPEGQTPPDYINVGAAVPGMGNHLVDAKDPEIADPTLGFSSTFIYGVYDAQMIFLEPMVSRHYLLTKPSACRPVRAPAKYATEGYYPTQYCVRHDAASGTYRVTLDQMVHRTAG